MAAARRPDIWTLIERYGSLFTLLVLVAVVAFLSPDFRKPENPLNILRQYSFVGIVAVGMTYVIILGGIDLSVGSMVALLGGAGIMLLNTLADHEVPTWLMLCAAAATMIGGGVVLGALNGTAITAGRIAPFVVTLGTMAIFRSVVLAAADGSEIRSMVPAFGEIASRGVDLPIHSSRGSPLELTLPMVAFITVAAVGQFVLSCTAFGRRVLAIGDNATAARYAGVPLSRVTIAVYAISGLCCGIAALLNSSRLNSVASSSLGSMYELDAIAAVVIGGTRMRGGAGSVFGTVIGVLILGVVGNMLNMLDVSPHLQGLVKGLIIIAAVLVQRFGRPV